MMLPSALSNAPESCLLMCTTTWARDSHELFDYEARQVHKRSYYLKQTSRVFRTTLDVKVIPEGHPLPAQAADYLLSVRYRDGRGQICVAENEHVVGRYVVVPADKSISSMDTYPIVSKKVWLIVKDLPDGKHLLKEADVIKLGRFKLRIRQLVANANEDAQIRLDGLDLTDPRQYKEDMSKVQCRICLLEGETDDDPLVWPCSCKGSIKFVHVSCLKHWIAEKSSHTKGESRQPKASFYLKHPTCELCLASIPTYFKIKSRCHYIVDLPDIKPPFIVLENLVGSDNAGIHVVSMQQCKELKLGRGHESDIRIADVSISRCHAMIRFDNDQFVLEDQNSKFGTLISLRKVRVIDPSQPLAVQAGRTIMSLSVRPHPLCQFTDCLSLDEAISHNLMDLSRPVGPETSQQVYQRDVEARVPSPDLVPELFLPAPSPSLPFDRLPVSLVQESHHAMLVERFISQTQQIQPGIESCHRKDADKLIRCMTQPNWRLPLLSCSSHQLSNAVALTSQQHHSRNSRFSHNNDPMNLPSLRESEFEACFPSTEGQSSHRLQQKSCEHVLGLMDASQQVFGHVRPDPTTTLPLSTCQENFRLHGRTSYYCHDQFTEMGAAESSRSALNSLDRRQSSQLFHSQYGQVVESMDDTSIGRRSVAHLKNRAVYFADAMPPAHPRFNPENKYAEEASSSGLEDHADGFHKAKVRGIANYDFETQSLHQQNAYELKGYFSMWLQRATEQYPDSMIHDPLQFAQWTYLRRMSCAVPTASASDSSCGSESDGHFGPCVALKGEISAPCLEASDGTRPSRRPGSSSSISQTAPAEWSSVGLADEVHQRVHPRKSLKPSFSNPVLSVGPDNDVCGLNISAISDPEVVHDNPNTLVHTP